jgi:hypothetical protein
MSKKDWELVAKAIDEVPCYDIRSREGDELLVGFMVFKGSIVDSISKVMEDNYPNFDREKFIAACYQRNWFDDERKAG